MANTTVIRPVGPTLHLVVGTSQHAAVAVPAPGNDQCNYAAFTNSGTADVLVVIAPYAATPATPTITIPADGASAPTGTYMLGASMPSPIVLAIPPNGFCVSAIATSGASNDLWITPVGDQS